MEIKSNFEALCEALYLAITAPTDKQAGCCAEMAESIAALLPDDQIALAKIVATEKAWEAQA